MPTDYIKKLSKEGKGSIEHLEEKWDDAKKVAAENGKADNYAVITTIFKNMINAKLEAVARLRKTQHD